jgi:hypothetical protein
MGEEVRVVPVTPDLQVAEGRAACLLASCDKYVIIYTWAEGYEDEQKV